MGDAEQRDIATGEVIVLELIRRFIVVAEQLHFGRAAEDLHIAQPVLSRQIRALEDELKAQLFVRDKRRPS